MTDEPSAGESADVPQKVRYIHSDIYDRLVETDDDLVGLVAYGIYQSAKRRWIKNFQRKHSETPSEPQVKDFCFTYDKERLDKLRAESQELIFRVTEERLSERVRETSETAFNVRTTEELSKVHSELNRISGYWHHIVGHVVGFVVLVGIVLFGYLITHFEVTVGYVANLLK